MNKPLVNLHLNIIVAGVVTTLTDIASYDENYNIYIMPARMASAIDSIASLAKLNHSNNVSYQLMYNTSIDSTWYEVETKATHDNYAAHDQLNAMLYSILAAQAGMDA